MASRTGVAETPSGAARAGAEERVPSSRSPGMIALRSASVTEARRLLVCWISPRGMSVEVVGAAVGEGSQHEALGVRVRRIEHVLGGAGDPGPAGHGGDDGLVLADAGGADQAAHEARADEGLVDEVGLEGELAAGVQLRHAGAGPGAAGGAVEPAGVD